MLVSDLVEDLSAALKQRPDAAGWRVGVATYAEGPGGDISVMYVASFHVDADDEFFLVPEGMGDAFDLEERPLTAGELLSGLQAMPGWDSFPAYVHSGIIELPDGSFASRNKPLWGTGVQEQAQLVYFYYGDSAAGT